MLFLGKFSHLPGILALVSDRRRPQPHLQFESYQERVSHHDAAESSTYQALFITFTPGFHQ